MLLLIDVRGLRLLGSLFLYCTEAVEILYLEVLDVSSLTANILLGHANIDVGALLEELRSLAGIADDKQRHHELGSHIVETTSQEVLSVLILQSLDISQSLLVNGDELLDTSLQTSYAVAALDRSSHLLDVVQHGAVGDVTDSSHYLQLSGTLVDREDTCVAEQALALVLHDEARTTMDADSIVGVLVGILGVHTLSQWGEGISQTLVLLQLLLLLGCELAVALDILEALVYVYISGCLVQQ